MLQCDLNAMVVFARVAASKSLSRAARELKIPNSTVSRKLADLEHRLGVRLINRTTRHLSLTEIGETYYGYCQRIMREVEGAEDAIDTLRDRPSGLLRIASPIAFGRHVMPSVITRFHSVAPDVRIEVVLSNERLDPVEEGLNLAIRCGPQPDSALLSRKIGTGRAILVASPEYLARHDRPGVPNDIYLHQCLTESGSTPHSQWTFNRSGEQQTIVPPAVFSSNDPEMLRDACRAGMGVARLPYFACSSDIRSGQLVTLLTDWKMNEPDVTIVYPAAPTVPTKVRLFIEQLASTWATWEAETLRIAA